MQVTSKLVNLTLLILEGHKHPDNRSYLWLLFIFSISVLIFSPHWLGFDTETALQKETRLMRKRISTKKQLVMVKKRKVKSITCYTFTSLVNRLHSPFYKSDEIQKILVAKDTINPRRLVFTAELLSPEETYYL